ncbi:MAG: hypothetical protein RSC86_04945, partial [Oscillospiraceae bacterium]
MLFYKKTAVSVSLERRPPAATCFKFGDKSSSNTVISQAGIPARKVNIMPCAEFISIKKERSNLMSKIVTKACVIGSGVMGASIAALLASVG